MMCDKQQRHLSLISEYVADICYICRRQNIVADCLSRPTNAVMVDLCDLPALAHEQLADGEMKSYAKALRSLSGVMARQVFCVTSQLPFLAHLCQKHVDQVSFQVFMHFPILGIKTTLRLIKSDTLKFAS